MRRRVEVDCGTDFVGLDERGPKGDEDTVTDIVRENVVKDARKCSTYPDARCSIADCETGDNTAAHLRALKDDCSICSTAIDNVLSGSTRTGDGDGSLPLKSMFS